MGWIGKPGKGVVLALIEALRDEHVDVRVNATKALGEIGEPAKAAVAALTETLNDPNRTTRIIAAFALYRIDNAKIDMVISVLINGLSDEHVGVHSYAVSVLNEIGKPAVPALINALRSKFEPVRHNAAQALRMIGTPEALKALKTFHAKDRMTEEN